MATKPTMDLSKRPVTRPQDLAADLDSSLREMESLMMGWSDMKDVTETRGESFDNAKKGLSETFKDTKDTDGIDDFLTLEDEYYPMTHPQRGDCLVFVNRKFKGGNLPHTQNDLRAVKETFHALGFTVIVYEDINKDCLLRTLKQAGEKDRSDHDAVVVIFSSHGNVNAAGREVLSTFDGCVYSSRLWSDFMKSESLAGKPKLFFIDACRGAGLDEKVQVGLSVSTDSINDKTASTAPVFYHPDMLVMNSSFAGMKSKTFKGKDFKGSVFTQMVCRTLLEEKDGDKDLMDQLQKVTRRVGARYSKQIPQTSSTLTRRLRFRC